MANKWQNYWMNKWNKELIKTQPIQTILLFVLIVYELHFIISFPTFLKLPLLASLLRRQWPFPKIDIISGVRASRISWKQGDCRSTKALDTSKKKAFKLWNCHLKHVGCCFTEKVISYHSKGSHYTRRGNDATSGCPHGSRDSNVVAGRFHEFKILLGCAQSFLLDVSFRDACDQEQVPALYATRLASVISYFLFIL